MYPHGCWIDTCHRREAADYRAESRWFRKLEKEGLVLIVTSDRRNISGGYKGVRLDKVTGKFQVRHQHQNKRKHLGIFHTAEEAALCYARYMRDTGR